MQLVGKLYRVKEGWQADWIFVDGGKVLSRWTEKHADARRVMATGADGAANALVRRYAKRGTAKHGSGSWRWCSTWGWSCSG